MPTDPLHPVRTEAGAFPGAGRGVTLHRYAVVPDDPASTRARLAVVHGYGDHAGRYLEFMNWLAARGVACHALDLRGHGRATGRRGFVRRWDEYLDDLGAFLDLPDLRPSAPRAQPPLFLLGHSHGGLIVAAAGVRGLLPDSVAGCVLSAPYLVNCHRVPAAKVAAGRVLNVLVPWVRIRSGVRPDMMSGDPVMLDDARRDPLLLRSATPRWFLTHRPVQAEVMSRAASFTRPLMVLYGEGDPIADPRGAAEFHARAGSPRKKLVAYAGMRHEPLRDARRGRVYEDVLGWLRDLSSVVVP
jgi:alpha-beta hydrolase superfamily lysophospholipase